MISEVPRWMALVVLALLLVGLLAFARGISHQRGDDVGSLRSGLERVALPAARG